MNEANSVQCPYCGEAIVIEPDPSDETVEYTEDCHVCCRPIVVTVTYSDEGSVVTVQREDA